MHYAAALPTWSLHEGESILLLLLLWLLLWLLLATKGPSTKEAAAHERRRLALRPKHVPPAKRRGAAPKHAASSAGWGTLPKEAPT